MAQVSIQRGPDSAPSMRVTPDVGNAGGIELQATASAPKSKPAPAHVSRPARREPSPPSPSEEDVDEDALNDIVNPGKVQDGESASSYSSRYDDGDDDSYEDDGPVDPVFAPPPREQPGPGFLTIEDEKADIMFRLELLKKQGYESRKFSARDDIREMRAELTRIKTHLELERSLKFSRKALVGVSAAIEFFNDKVDVLDLELDGWSEQMHQAVYNQKEYDGIFEELFFKYRNKIKTPPEIRLLLAVGGSALTFHITNSMFKKSSQPAIDPAVIQKLMESQRQTAPSTTPESFEPSFQPSRPPSFEPPSFEPPSKPPSTSTRYEMRPPMMPPFGLSTPPVPSRVTDVRANSPIERAPIERAPMGIDEDRLSDVPSDLDSIPSEMTSPDIDDTAASLIKSITLTPGKKGAPEKRVIEI